MPGWDDSRYVQAQFEALKKDVELLKKKSLPFAVHQRGAIPGDMNAIRINTQGQASSMWASYTNDGPGKGPYWAVTDPNGVIRVEGGNLASNGISPAQYGLRTADANGAPITDSQGLIQVMSELGHKQLLAGPYTFNTTSDVLLTGSAVTFSLVRQQRVLISVNASGGMNTGNAGSLDVFLDNNSRYLSFMQWQGASITSTGALVVSDVLPAGSHTYDLRGLVNVGGNTLTILVGLIYVWLLGD